MTETYVPLKLINEKYSEDKSGASSPSSSHSEASFDHTLEKSNLGYRDIISNCGKYRFKLGIIDFLTLYNTSKFFENEIK